MAPEITGIISPVLTPFDEEGNLVPDRITNSVDFALACECHAIVAAGTGVQETTALSVEERKTVVTETIDEVDGARPVLAGVSHPAQPVVTDLVNHASQAGADAVLAMPPWGMTPSEEAIFRYYRAIDEVTDLPILLYNNPGVTTNMSKRLIVRIATEINGVRYVKESLRDWSKIAALVERVHHDGHADILTTMDVLLPTLQVAGTGIITPAPLTTPSMRIYEAFERDELERAWTLQRTFGDFPPDAARTGLTGVCKTAAEIAGVAVGSPRFPYLTEGTEGRRAIARWMDENDVPRMS